MKAASGKAKGRRLQQWVAAKLHEIAPELEDGDVKSTSMGAGGEDVQLSPAARRRFGVSIECKAYEKFAIYTHYEQAEKNAAGRIPVLIIKGNRKKPLLVADAETILRIIANERRNL